MIRNYFNVALRNLTKHKFYSIINILGLSVGLTCFLFIALFVSDERSFDQHFDSSNRIYRLDFEGSFNGNDINSALMCSPAARTIVEDFPDVEDAFRFRGSGKWFVNIEGEQDVFKFGESTVAYSDPNFADFWGVHMIYGDAESCLSRPKTLIMNQTTAQKIFGDLDPVGEKLILDGDKSYEVGGVYEDLPEDTHFHYEMLITMLDHPENDMQVWLSFNFNTYLKFAENADPREFETILPDLVKDKFGSELQKYLGSSFEQFIEAGNSGKFNMVALEDIHLKSQKLGDIEANGDIKYVYIFSAIALFILALACINFMNLATARSAGRAKEVGVRKVMGAQKTQLIRQFLTEALMISFIAMVIAMVVSFFLLPYFNLISGKTLTQDALLDFRFVSLVLAVTTVAGVLAGSYPAFFLSAFRPVETLKGKLNLGMKSGGLRSTLVVFQFVISIIMIICTAVVYDQMQFIQNKKLGFNKEHVIAVDDVWILGDKRNIFVNEVKRNAMVTSGTLTGFVPIGSDGNNNVYWPGEQVNSEQTYVFNRRIVDYDFVPTMEMAVEKGRTFSREFSTDTLAIMVNQALVRKLGFENPIGEKLSAFDGNEDTEITTYHIIGVVEDFHYNSMKTSINPLLFVLEPDQGGVALFRYGNIESDQMIRLLRKKWEELAPGQPFEYYFLDTKYDNSYKAEQQVGRIFGIFASLAIFIACLGLFGLASFTAEQRIKEIGVRKVLGASVTQIVNMLSWNFIRLVGIAFLVAVPLAYYGMGQWLEGFAYRTELKLWIFLAAGMAATVIAWLTMGYQSWRAASINPAKSLRSE